MVDPAPPKSRSSPAPLPDAPSKIVNLSNARARAGVVLWVAALAFCGLIPLLALVIFPELLTASLETYLYVVYVAGTGLFLVIAFLLARVGRRYLKRGPLRLHVTNRRAKLLLVGLAFLPLVAGAGATGYVAYEAIGPLVRTYRPSGPYVVTPKVGAPEFPAPGGTFPCALAGDASFQARAADMGLHASIARGEGTPVVLGVTRVNGTHANLTVPAGTAPGLYSLRLVLGDTVFTEPFAVRVWDPAARPATRPFRVAHLTDTHIAPGEHGVLADHLQAQVTAVARMHPDLVIMTGDLTDDGTVRQFQALQALTTQFGEYGLPVFEILGNHDMRDEALNALAYWDRHIAPAHFTRDVPGEHLRFVAFNTGSRGVRFNLAQELPYVTRALATCPADSEVVLACHIPPYRFCDWAAGAGQETELCDLCDAYGVQALIAGHSHDDRVVGRRSTTTTDAPGDCSRDYPPLAPPFAETAYIETLGKYNGPAVRWITFQAGRVVNCTYDADADGQLDQASSIELAGLNFGETWLPAAGPRNWTGTPRNPLNVPLWDARVHVELPAGTSPAVLASATVRVVETSPAHGCREVPGTVADAWNTTTSVVAALAVDLAAHAVAEVSLVLPEN